MWWWYNRWATSMWRWRWRWWYWHIGGWIFYRNCFHSKSTFLRRSSWCCNRDILATGWRLWSILVTPCDVIWFHNTCNSKWLDWSSWCWRWYGCWKWHVIRECVVLYIIRNRFFCAWEYLFAVMDSKREWVLCSEEMSHVVKRWRTIFLFTYIFDFETTLLFFQYYRRGVIHGSSIFCWL